MGFDRAVPFGAFVAVLARAKAGGIQTREGQVKGKGMMRLEDRVFGPVAKGGGDLERFSEGET